MHTRQNKLMNCDHHFELRRYPKHVAYLFHGCKLIAVSTNAWGKHAEMGLLPYLRRDQQQSMYVKRISDVNPMSRPCVRCSMSIRHVCPRVRIFYTNEDGDWTEDVQLNSSHKSRKDTGQASVTYRLRKKRHVVRH